MPGLTGMRKIKKEKKEISENQKIMVVGVAATGHIAYSTMIGRSNAFSLFGGAKRRGG
jgi:hypothetical protein